MINIPKNNYIIEAKNDKIAIVNIENQDGSIQVGILPIEHLAELDKTHTNIADTKLGGLIITEGLTGMNANKVIQEMIIPTNGQKGNSNINKLMEQLSILAYIRAFESEVESTGAIKTYLPNMAVFEREAVSIKIPTFYFEERDNHWDYEYLMEPISDFLEGQVNFNSELSSKLRRAYSEWELDENFKPDAPLAAFSINRYRIAQLKYRIASSKTKALIRICREKEDQSNFLSRYYNIYQKTRMARTDKLGYMQINWKDPLTAEMTFPKIVESLTGQRVESLRMKGAEKTVENLKRMLKDVEDKYNNLQPKTKEDKQNLIVLYVMIEDLKSTIEYFELCSDTDVKEALTRYEQYEEDREETRREIFKYNLGLWKNLDNIVRFYNGIMPFPVNNIMGLEFSDRYNDIRLTFSRKTNIITEEREPEEFKVEDFDWEGLDDEILLNSIQW